MHTQLNKTKRILEEFREFKGQMIYLTFVKLLETLQQDIRIHNDVEKDVNEMLRNQGAIHWFGEIVRLMTKDAKHLSKPTDTNVDGGYSPI